MTKEKLWSSKYSGGVGLSVSHFVGGREKPRLCLDVHDYDACLLEMEDVEELITVFGLWLSKNLREGHKLNHGKI